MTGIINVARKKDLGVATFPANKAPEVIEKLSKLFPLEDQNGKKVITFKPLTPMEMVLGGNNYIPHPAVVGDAENLVRSLSTVFPNTSLNKPKPGETDEIFRRRIKQSYNHYVDGITPRIGQILKAMDEERLNIANKLGMDIPSWPEVMDKFYKIGKYDDFHEMYQACKEFYTFNAPVAKDLANHRNLTEDLPKLLVIEALGKICDVNTQMTTNVRRVIAWNAITIGTPKEVLLNYYTEALNTLPDSIEGLRHYLDNPCNSSFNEINPLVNELLLQVKNETNAIFDNKNKCLLKITPNPLEIISVPIE